MCSVPVIVSVISFISFVVQAHTREPALVATPVKNLQNKLFDRVLKAWSSSSLPMTLDGTTLAKRPRTPLLTVAVAAPLAALTAARFRWRRSQTGPRKKSMRIGRCGQTNSSIISFQIKRLREGSYEDQARASVVLFSLAGERNNDEICKQGGVRALVQVLCDGAKASKENSQKALAAQEAAAAALVPLAVTSQNKDLIRERGGIKPLVTALEDGTQLGQETAAAVLDRLSTHNIKNQALIREEGGVLPLIKLLHKGSGRCKIYVRKALFNIWKNLHKEDVNTLAILLEEGSKELQEIAAGCLSDLAVEDYNQGVIRDGGGIPPLVEMLRKGGLELQKRAALALCSLAQSQENQNVIVEEEGIEAVIKVLREGKDEVQAAAASMCVYMMEDEQTAQALCDDGGVPPLIKILDKGSPETQACAAAALACLTFRGGGERVLAYGGLKALLKASKQGIPKVRKHAKSALRGLGHEVPEAPETPEKQKSTNR